MRLHLIENGVVANTIEAETLELAQALFPAWTVADADLGGAIGDTYDPEAATFAPPPAAVPTEAEVIAGYMAAVQEHMDDTAVQFGYDNLLSVISYADEPAVARYQTEGQQFRAWRSQCWATCESVLAAVRAGQRVAPTDAELLAELPAAPVQVPL